MVAPLSSLRVLDLSRILAGPYATQLLADLGAQVTKVESPTGDPTRIWGPPFQDGESAYYRAANRGKKRVTLDLNVPEDRTRLDRLISESDVLVENFLPESARKWNLTPDQLRLRHPDLIVASIRSYASDTDESHRPGYDLLLQAESGWMSITGEPEGSPMKVGVALVDVLAGVYLANGIQAALLHRDHTGEALHVECPLMEVALSGLINVGAAALMTDESPNRLGNGHPHIVPYQAFACADGNIVIAVGNDAQFESLMIGLGLEKLLQEKPEWKTNPGRVLGREQLVSELERRIAVMAMDEALQVCAEGNIPAGPIRDVCDALVGGEGVVHHAIVDVLDAETGQKSRGVGTPLILNGARCPERRPPTGPE